MSLRQPIAYTQYRGHKRLTQPASEPVTAAELQAFLRETSAGLPDSEAEAFIAQAREWIEDKTGVAMINQAWTLALDDWPMQSRHGQWWSGVREGAIGDLSNPANIASVYLPRYPLSSITSVTTYAENSASTAITVADTFDVDAYQRPGRITLKYGVAWPVALRANNAVEIVYVAGYGADAAVLPAGLKRAVMQLAAALYSNRGDGCGCGDVYASSGAQSMVSAYSVARL